MTKLSVFFVHNSYTNVSLSSLLLFVYTDYQYDYIIIMQATVHNINQQLFLQKSAYSVENVSSVIPFPSSVSGM